MLADREAEVNAGLLGVEHHVDFFLRQRNRLGIGAHEAGDAAGIPDDIPAFAGFDHVHKHITGIHLTGALDALSVPDLDNFLHGDPDFKDQVLHAVVLDGFFQRVFHLVLVTRVGMDHIPARLLFVFSHVSSLLCYAISILTSADAPMSSRPITMPMKSMNTSTMME